MLGELIESMRVIALPTKTNFRGIQVREAALFKGPMGWGEFSPFLEYGYQACVPWLLSAFSAATLATPTLFRKSIKVNGTIPAINDEEELERILNSFSGCDTFKIKVGNNLHEDLLRIARVQSLAPHAKLRIDVNGGWTVSQALTNLPAMYESAEGFEYVEQPCATIEELRELKEKINIPLMIAGDEVLRKAENPFEVKLDGVIDILVLKVQPLGGIERAHRLAAHHNLPVVISSALESAVGINYGLKLAASFESNSWASGLGTGALLSANVAALPIINGEIAVSDFEPDFTGVEASPDRYQWWKNRVMKVAELLP